MIILDLVLKSEWYDLIKSGDKKHEYRAIKEYWSRRLFAKHYSHIRFRRGNTRENMLFELTGIEISADKNDLNLPEVYKISLGSKVE